jgi:hypothetical protein
MLKFFLFLTIVLMSSFSHARYSLLGNDYWPFECETYFPWKEVNGMWKIQGSQKTKLKLQDISLSNQNKILFVSHFDGKSNKPIFSGYGTEYGRRILVRMVDHQLRFKYWLVIGQVSEIQEQGQCSKTLSKLIAGFSFSKALDELEFYNLERVK